MDFDLLGCLVNGDRHIVLHQVLHENELKDGGLYYSFCGATVFSSKVSPPYEIWWPGVMLRRQGL